MLYFYPLCQYVFFSGFFFTLVCIPFSSLWLHWFYFLSTLFLRSVSFDFISFTFFNIYFLRILISTLWYYSREAIVIQIFKFIKYLLTIFNWYVDLLSVNLLLFGFCIILGLMAAETDKCFWHVLLLKLLLLLMQLLFKNWNISFQCFLSKLIFWL